LQPEQIIPGVADYYATSVDGFDFKLTFKTREGRPIKIDNNTITELDFPLMLEFMHRYCRYMTTLV
jgi:molybdopterin-containing oxidoreductase family iron-sulfur binding subunit